MSCRIARSLLPLLPFVASCTSAAAPVAKEPAAASAMIPARLLRCTIGRALNLDPSKRQTIADIRYDGQYQLDLFLPAIAKRTASPPDATEAPEPVDPATRILQDSAGLTREVPPGFDRVVDMWPERVELTRIIREPLTNLVIVSDVDESHGTANIFMTQATDAVTFDMQHVYQGGCVVTQGSAAVAAARSESELR